MKKLVLVILLLTNGVFASIESEVVKDRFQKKDGVVIDTWLNQIWQDQPDNINLARAADLIKASSSSRYRDKLVTDNRYCQNLKLYNKSNWRIPKRDELLQVHRNAKNKFKYISDGYYWTDQVVGRPIPIIAVIYRYLDVREALLKHTLHVRCVSGDKIYRSKMQEIANNAKREKKVKKEEYVYKKYSKSESIKEVEFFLNNYKDIRKKYYKNIEKKAQKLYTKEYQDISKQNNIVGYEWFIKTYPKASEAREALAKIYKLAFSKTKDIGTIKAYNTFIYSYPLAPQVKKANDLAYKIEEKKYTDLGMLGFFGKEEKLEKKARKLLIKAKQIERYPADNDIENREAGYLIVANRMYTLLQDKFDDTDATLRYLESQEFKDFVHTFRNIMRDIKHTLNQIQDNTSKSSRYIKELVEVSSKGFSDAKSDREMASYYTKEHRKWEKFMHSRDKGYN